MLLVLSEFEYSLNSGVRIEQATVYTCREGDKRLRACPLSGSQVPLSPAPEEARVDGQVGSRYVLIYR